MPVLKRLSKTIIIFIFMIIIFISNFSSLNPHILNKTNAGSISVDEKLGESVPMDLPFTDENGKKVLIRNVVKGPTILTIVYYRCPNVCSIVISNLATVIKNSSYETGKVPNIVIVSINENENSSDAMKTKKVTQEIIQSRFLLESWHFLTGSKDSIKKLTDAIGFNFVKYGTEYDHPIGLIILSPEGKISRYIMGTGYLPLDITMSLMEASSGITGPTIARVLRFCFSYDPVSHNYVFNTLRISAVVIITLVVILIFYLVFGGKKRRAGKGAMK